MATKKMAAKKKTAVSEVEVEAQEILAEARKQAAVARVLDSLRANSGQRQGESRAADPEDPLDEDTAQSLATQATEASDRAEAVLKAAGLKEADVQIEVTEARRAELIEHLRVWKANLTVHQSFLSEPETWGGVDLSGAPLVPEEQAIHVKSLEAAIADAERELAG